VQERTHELEHANAQLRVEIAERQRAEDERQRILIEQRDTLTFLGAVSETLAPIVEVDKLLEAVPRLPVPFAADWTMVCVQTEDGAIRAEAGVHLDPTRMQVLARLAVAFSESVPTEVARSSVLLQAITVCALSRVPAATTTAEALESLAAAAPDLLVADLGLPGEDG
jgi:hypothetical protein